MSLRDDVEVAARAAVWTDWKPRTAQSIPESGDIGLTNGDAVMLEGVWMYADLRDSSGLAQRLSAETAGTCIATYLRCASLIIRRFGGEIRSFDGDRVMAIFPLVNAAVSSALHIAGAVEEILRPKLELKFPALKASRGWYMEIGIGIDWGRAMVVRAGVRGSNDLVSIGAAPNVAAKLSDVKSAGKSIFITAPCYAVLRDEQRVSGSGDVMWKRIENQVVGGKSIEVYASGWYRKLR